jgi:hypothetical protein
LTTENGVNAVSVEYHVAACAHVVFVWAYDWIEQSVRFIRIHATYITLYSVSLLRPLPRSPAATANIRPVTATRTSATTATGYAGMKLY